MDIGRREHYRVQISETDRLCITVHKPGQAPRAGRLVDVSASGAGVLFPPPEPPDLIVGQVADLVFNADQLKEPLTVAARVQHRAEEDGARRYGFRFLQAQNLETYLPPEFRQYFNRRRTPRVAPDPNEPVTIRLEIPVRVESPGDEPPVEGRLENISVGGAAISLDAAMELTFAKTTSVRIALLLPGARQAIDMIGEIRNRRLVGRMVHYGIEFDAEASENSKRQIEMIAKYVAKREKRDARAVRQEAKRLKQDLKKSA